MGGPQFSEVCIGLSCHWQRLQGRRSYEPVSRPGSVWHQTASREKTWHRHYVTEWLEPFRRSLVWIKPVQTGNGRLQLESQSNHPSEPEVPDIGKRADVGQGPLYFKEETSSLTKYFRWGVNTGLQQAMTKRIPVLSPSLWLYTEPITRCNR